MTESDGDKGGALNLIENCLDVLPGSDVLLVCEHPELGWYDDEIAQLLTETLRGKSAKISKISVGAPDDELPPNYPALVNTHDTIIYLARIGDQDRFTDNLPGKKVVMLYARDVATLTSAYGSTHHHALKELKDAVDQVTLSAIQISITCPLGTDLNCKIPKNQDRSTGDVAVKRFPLCVPQPVLASDTTGKVALAGWLTPTGSQSYSPASCAFDTVVFAGVEKGRITGFEGHAQCVEAIESHYQRISQRLGIDKDAVHSWHAGIHPACWYPGNVADDPDRWSNNVFGNPRFLHFHTCGDYPPGEICWMVLDPTIIVDGTALWENGRLMVENFDVTLEIIKHWPELNKLARTSNVELGLSN